MTKNCNSDVTYESTNENAHVISLVMNSSCFSALNQVIDIHVKLDEHKES